MILVSTEWQIFQSISLIFHLFRCAARRWRRPTFWAPDWKVCTSSRWEVCDRSDRRHSLGGKRIYTPANKDFSDQLYNPFIYCAFELLKWLSLYCAFHDIKFDLKLFRMNLRPGCWCVSVCWPKLVNPISNWSCELHKTVLRATISCLL